MIVLPYGDHHVIGGAGAADVRVDPRAARPAAVGDDAAAPPRRRRARGPSSCAATCTPTTRCSIRRCGRCRPVFVVRLPDGPAAGWVQASIDYALASRRAVEPVAEPDRDAPARAGAHRGAAHPPRDRAGRSTTAGSPRCATRCSRRRCRCCTPSPDARWTVAELAAAVGRVAIAARRALPPGARPVADPLPHRVAHAPGRGAARHDRAVGVHDRPAGRLRLRGGVQPGVQARAGRLAEPLAGDPSAATAALCRHPCDRRRAHEHITSR